MLRRQKCLAYGWCASWIERFKDVRMPRRRLLFAPQVFFNPMATETDVLFPDVYARLRERWVAGGVRYIGDADPVDRQRCFVRARSLVCTTGVGTPDSERIVTAASPMPSCVSR